MIAFNKRFHIGRSPPAVFDYLTDPARFHEWQAGTRAAAWTSSGPPGVGSTITVTASLLGRPVEVALVVTAWDPPHRYRVKSTGGPAAGEMDHRLADQGEGTLLTVEGRFDLTGALRLASGLATRQVEKGVEADAGRLRAKLEGL